MSRCLISGPLLNDGKQLIAEAIELEPFRRWMAKTMMLCTSEDALVCIDGSFLGLALPVVIPPALEKVATVLLCWPSVLLRHSITSSGAYSVEVTVLGAVEHSSVGEDTIRGVSPGLRSQGFKSNPTSTVHSLFPHQVLICSETQFPFP